MIRYSGVTAIIVKIASKLGQVRPISISRRWFLLIAVALSTSAAHGAVFCVGDSAALKTALDIVQNNGQDNQIKVQHGTYFIGYTMSPISPHALNVLGGFDPTCSKMSGNAADTLLLPESSENQVFNLFVGGNLHVANLHFHGFDGGAYTDSVLFIAASGASALLIENVIVDGCSNAETTAALDVMAQSPAATITLRNILVHDNTAPVALQLGGPIDFQGNPEPHADIALSGVTVVKNSGIGILIQPLANSSLALLSNSVSFGNSGADVVVPHAPIRSEANDIGSVSPGQGAFTSTLQANDSVNPQLDSQFRPLSGSPLVDSGIAINGITPDFDLRGCPRTQGQTLDRGAVESGNSCDTLFHNGFDNAGAF